MLRAERISRGVDRRRSAILEVARDLLSRDGMAAFTMERVADEAGYARTAIYRYFSSREELIVELAAESLELRVELYRRIARFEGRPRERMVAFGEVTCLLYPRHVLPQVFAFAHAVLEKTSESSQERLRALQQEDAELIASVAREAVANGDLDLSLGITLEEVLFGLNAFSQGMFERIELAAAVRWSRRSARRPAAHGRPPARRPRLAAPLERVGLPRDHGADLRRGLPASVAGGPRPDRRGFPGNSGLENGGSVTRIDVEAGWQWSRLNGRTGGARPRRGRDSMRTKGWIAALAMLTMLIGVPAVHADGPQTGTLEGRVLDAEGKPLPGVTVNLAGPQGQSSTVTGDDGDFRFGLLVAGEYTVGATLEGLGSTEVDGPARRRTAPAARTSRSAARPPRPSPSPRKRR